MKFEEFRSFSLPIFLGGDIMKLAERRSHLWRNIDRRDRETNTFSKSVYYELRFEEIHLRHQIGYIRLTIPKVLLSCEESLATTVVIPASEIISIFYL